MDARRMNRPNRSRALRVPVTEYLRNIFIIFLAGLAVVLALMVQAARASDGDAAASDAVSIHESDPMTLVVSLSAQRIDVYRGDTLISSSRVSTGKPGHSTPAGVYSILEKRRHHRSNIYSRAPMPFMQRITWSGIALHEGRVPNQPASHGCIRLPSGFASELFGSTERGVHVLITDGEMTLRQVQHESLFQVPSLIERTSSLATLEQSAANDVVVVPASFVPDFEQDIPGDMAEPEMRSSSPLRILITRRTGREQVMDAQTLLTELGYDPGEIDGYMGPMTSKAILAFQNDRELQPTGAFSETLLANLYRFAGKGEVPTGHIYVRQDYIDILDAPMHIDGGDAVLGTHVYQAMDFVHDGSEVRWVGSTLEPVEGTDMMQALERVHVPGEIRERIADLMSPGSSLVISDHGLGRETGRGTDFIVQPR